MGEVRRAVDSQLGRGVALKLLPQGFAEDAERVARFEREAKVLASLNHPTIAQIYGLETRGGQKALVMELVEGPTLTADGRWIVFTSGNNEHLGLFRMRPDGSEPSQLTSGNQTNGEVSPDGRAVTLALTRETRALMLAEGLPV